MISMLSIYAEPLNKRIEFSQFISFKILEAVWGILKQMKIVNCIRNGNVYVFALACGGLNYFYNHEPEKMNQVFLSILKRCWESE